MKKQIFTLAIATILGSATCMAQDEIEKKGGPDNSQRIEQMISELGLNETQAAEFKEIMKDMQPQGMGPGGPGPRGPKGPRPDGQMGEKPEGAPEGMPARPEMGDESKAGEGPQGDMKEKFEEMQSKMKEADEKLKSCLTEEQYKKFQEMFHHGHDRKEMKEETKE